jgi:HD-like signal output (HDOD) protein
MSKKSGLLCLLKDPGSIADAQKLRDDWEVAFVPSQEHALEALGQGSFQTFVTDTGSRGAGDKDILSQVTNRFHDVVRVLLFDPAKEKAAVNSDGSAHQCIGLPCPAEVLTGAAHRAQLVARWMATPAVKKWFPRLRKLPSVPTIYARLVQALKDPDTDLEKIGQIIGEDLVMTAKVLQLVNSPFFALGRTITSPGEAVGHLGIERTKSLVLLAHVFSGYNSDAGLGFSIEKLWRHSMAVAHFARRLALLETRQATVADAAYTAGMLHDAGKLMIAVNLPEEYRRIAGLANTPGWNAANAETEVLGVSHATLAACVFGIWGLPTEILEAIAFHHTPERHDSKGFSPLTAVYASNLIEHELRAGPGKAADHWDSDYLERLGLSRQIEVWRALCADELPRDSAA